MLLPSARLPTVLLLMMSSGCGAEAPGSCKVGRAVDATLLDKPGIPTVIGHLRDQKVAVLLDTGAATTSVTPSAVSRLRLDSDPDHTTFVTGIGGTTRTSFASIHRLELGGGHASSFDLPIVAELEPEIRGLPVLGLFGADFMSNYDVDFDLPHHHFAMYTLTGCGDAIQPVETPYFTVPFRFDRTTLKIAIEIRLNDVPIQAVLDSGASSTYITEADARRAGVTPDMLAADRVIHPRGVDGFPVEGHRHRFASLELGAERLNNVPVAVAPSAVGLTLLGDDFFRLNRIWISYPRRMLFIQPAMDNPIVHLAGRGP